MAVMISHATRKAAGINVLSPFRRIRDASATVTGVRRRNDENSGQYHRKDEKFDLAHGSEETVSNSEDAIRDPQLVAHRALRLTALIYR